MDDFLDRIFAAHASEIEALAKKARGIPLEVHRDAPRGPRRTARRVGGLVETQKFGPEAGHFFLGFGGGGLFARSSA